MTLAILICTLPERFEKLKRLKNILEPQVERFKDQVSISINDAGRHLPTGTKRNNLIEQTQSNYFCFIDDDDQVSAYYLSEIMSALSHTPDVITFQGYMTTNGENKRDWTIRLDEKYEERDGHYYRFPNHLCVFRRELVRHFKFPDIWIQEDYKWAEKIHNSRVLKTEIHIPMQIYHYDKIHTARQTFHERRR